ncbi:MAG TPA: VF530 family protein [Deferrisomatales bacterium]|nr:VF530 family protein [Deferrisomatales bacterium]
MREQQRNEQLHGLTLEMILNRLVDQLGWIDLGKRINIRCFNSDPSVQSSLKFLRKTPWAKRKVENLYIATQKTSRRR